MRLALSVVFALSMAMPANALQARMTLSASIPTRCSILDIDPDSLNRGQLRITAACNAASFDLILNGDLRNQVIRSAKSSQGQIVIATNRLRIVSDRPGDFTFDLDYGSALADVSDIQAEIRAL